MKQASTALKWAVDEMERRYQLFADAGTKNIATYNAWVGRVARGEAKNPNARVVVAKDHNGFTDDRACGEGRARRRSAVARKAPVDRRRGRRIRGPHDAARERGRIVGGPSGPEGARFRDARHPRDAAPERRRHHGGHQGKLPDAHGIPRLPEGRLAHHPRRARRRTPPRARRHAHQAERDERNEACAVPLGERGGGPAGDRLSPDPGRACIRRQHPQASR